MENNINVNEIQKALDEANVLIKQLRDENEQMKGEIDGLAKEKFEKMENQIKSLLQMNEKLVARVVAGEQKADGVVVSDDVKSAFVKFAKMGAKALTPEEKKALVEDSTGEILVPIDIEKEIIRALSSESVIRSLCSVRNTTSNRIQSNSLTKPVASWGKLETGATLSDSSPVPSQAVAYIEDLYALVKLGEDEVADSYVNLKAILSEDFAEAFGEKEDEGFIVGTGHANGQPEGLVTGAWGIGEVETATASTLTIDDIISLYFGLKSGYQGNATFVMNSQTAMAIMKLKDNNGQYLWQPSVRAGAPNLLLNKPVRLDDYMPVIADGNKVIAFGDFQRGCRIYDREGLGIKVLDQIYAEAGLIGYRAKKRVGFAVRRPEALKFLKIKSA